MFAARYLRVRADLVAFGDRTVDEGLVVGGEDVGPVVAVDEEGGADVVGFQGVEDLSGVDVWAIVERQSHGPGHGAAVDDRPERYRGHCRCGEGCRFGGLDQGSGLRAGSGPGGDAASGLGSAVWGWRGEDCGGPGGEEDELAGGNHGKNIKALVC